MQLDRCLSVFSIPLVLAALVMSSLVVADDIPEELDLKKIAEIFDRYDLPQAPMSVELVLAANGHATMVDGFDRMVPIFRPAIMIKKSSEEKGTVLIGFSTEDVESRSESPVIRPFTKKSSKSKDDPFVVQFNNLKTFETCVLLAWAGEEELAQELWREVSRAKHLSDGHADENLGRLLATPELLFARAIYGYFENETLKPDADLTKIQKQLVRLKQEFPTVFDESTTFSTRCSEFLNDLTLTVNAKPAAEGSVEALLIDWGNHIPHPTFDIFNKYNDDAAKSAREIVLKGTASFEDLAALASDRRITKQTIQAIGNAPSRRIRLGMLADDLLRKMIGAPSTDNFRRFPDTVIDWDSWLKENDFSNEEEFFKGAVFEMEDGRIQSIREYPLQILAARYAECLPDLARKLGANATDSTNCFKMTQVIIDSSLSLDTKTKVLTRLYDELPKKQKRSAIQELAKVNPSACDEIVLVQIGDLPSDVSEPYWTCEAANLTHVIMHLDNPEVWRQYLVAAKKSAVGLRMEMMNPMNYGYMGNKGAKYRLAFLAAFLDDETVRDKSSTSTKFDGPCAAFKHKKISVQNFVAMKLGSLLKVSGHPNQRWAPKQWNDYRQLVKTELEKHELPDLASGDQLF